MDVLHGVDLIVKNNEIVDLIGPNGSGKSTILKSIFNLCSVYSGKIIAEGPPKKVMKNKKVLEAYLGE